MKRNIAFLLLLGVLAGCATPRHETKLTEQRRQVFRGCLGTYDGEPRLPNGHVDIQRLLDDLKELHANTYSWLIWHGKTDWDDLKTFLPLARVNHINVWVTIVPPAESPPHTQKFSEPFRLDFDKWADELGKLSATEINLVAWSVDDFWYSREIFTPEKMRQLLKISRAHNPKLAFIPCIYLQHATPTIAEKYRGLFDAVLFPYMAKSQGGNLKDASFVESEMENFRSAFGKSMPVIVDVYATPHMKYRDGSSPQYVGDTLVRAHRSADGVMIYCHQDKHLSPDKFKIIKENFQQWNSGRD